VHHGAPVADSAPVTTAQKVGWVLLHVLLPYGWSKLSQWSLMDEDDAPDGNAGARWPGQWPLPSRRQVLGAMQRAERAMQATNLVHLLVFLYNGRYCAYIMRRLRCPAHADVHGCLFFP